jgi:hypothetical protein
VGRHSVALDVQAEDLGRAGRRAQQPQQQPDGGGLARPVRPQVAEHLARLDLKVERGQGLDAAEALRQAFGADGDPHVAHLLPDYYTLVGYISILRVPRAERSVP